MSRSRVGRALATNTARTHVLIGGGGCFDALALFGWSAQTRLSGPAQERAGFCSQFVSVCVYVLARAHLCAFVRMRACARRAGIDGGALRRRGGVWVKLAGGAPELS